MSKQNATKLVWPAVILAACVIAVPVGWVAYEPVKGWLFPTVRPPLLLYQNPYAPPTTVLINESVEAQTGEAPVEAPPVESD